MFDQWPEIAGFAASILVFITFSMKTIVPLRLVAIASNVAFITYGAGAHLLPILILHSALLPMNVFRTWQYLRVFRRIREAARGPAEASALVPFMTRETVSEGAEMFHKGDRAEVLYFLSKGRVGLPEIDKVLGAGELIGEVGLFSRDGRRTTSAICLEKCELFVIDRAHIHELYLQNSAFGYFLTKLIAGRMDENLSRLTRECFARSGEGAGEALQAEESVGSAD
jgi:CRP/FNR family transcriptional regulator, cyclic AMP receptor protein